MCHGRVCEIVLLEFKRTSDTTELFILPGHVETYSTGKAGHSHSKGPRGPGDRVIMGGRSHSVGRRAVVG
jgi:hypothetical protein